MNCERCGGDLLCEWSDCAGADGTLPTPATSAEAWQEFIPEGLLLCRCPCHAAVARDVDGETIAPTSGVFGLMKGAA